MAQSIGRALEGLVKLLGKKEFWIAIFIIVAIVWLGGVLASITVAPVSIELATYIMQVTGTVVLILAVLIVIVLWFRYGPK